MLVFFEISHKLSAARYTLLTFLPPSVNVWFCQSRIANCKRYSSFRLETEKEFKRIRLPPPLPFALGKGLRNCVEKWKRVGKPGAVEKPSFLSCPLPAPPPGVRGVSHHWVVGESTSFLISTSMVDSEMRKGVHRGEVMRMSTIGTSSTTSRWWLTKERSQPHLALSSLTTRSLERRKTLAQTHSDVKMLLSIESDASVQMCFVQQALNFSAPQI